MNKPISLREVFLALLGASVIGSLWLGGLILLSPMQWYQEMGEFFHEYPIVLAAVIAVFFALAIGIVVYIRRRYPEDY
jgi:ABC-type transporter Mla maintaining outer membrane lipid asymmetry permease subunit MlaE